MPCSVDAIAERHIRDLIMISTGPPGHAAYVNEYCKGNGESGKKDEMCFRLEPTLERVTEKALGDRPEYQHATFGRLGIFPGL